MYKIKFLSLVTVAILIGGVFSNAAAQRKTLMQPVFEPPLPVDQTLNGSYSMNVNASQLSTGEVELTTRATYGWTCYGSTEGDLSGFLFVSLNYSSDNSLSAEVSPGGVSIVTGGSWSKLIFVKGLYVGSVYGKIVGGEFIRNKSDGTVTVILALTADEGTGSYVGSVGSGTFEGSLDPNSKVPGVTGKLVLNY